MLPIVLAHKWMFGFSLLALVHRPRGAGADPQRGRPGDRHAGKPSGHVARVLRHPSSWCSRVIRFVLTYLSRNYLLKTAYRIEYDLRNIIYEHLSRMSFSFYDRVQSGQLISRANSDIRSVQMYLTFAPLILVQCSVAVLAFVEMLLDQRAARVRRDVDDAVRLHRRREDAEADVPGVVAHPGAPRRRGHRRRREHQRRAGRQVVRGRGAAAAAPGRRRRAGASGPTSRTPTSGPAGRPADREPAPARPGARAALRRLPGRSTATRRSATSSRSTPTC